MVAAEQKSSCKGARPTEALAIEACVKQNHADDSFCYAGRRRRWPPNRILAERTRRTESLLKDPRQTDSL